MQYNGFISTLIDRSEDLLMSDHRFRDDLNVTRLLLVLNTGFALVWERIRYWDDADDLRLRSPKPWKEVRKACKGKLGAPITIQERSFFDNFQTCKDWTYFRVPKERQGRSLTAHNIVRCLAEAEMLNINGLKLDAVMWALRNSFAHGGVLPMSPEQAGPRVNASNLAHLNSQQIDRVYFVSKWTGDSIQDDLGWIVVEFGLNALQAFWDDWRAIILSPGKEALEQLDRAA